MWTEPIRKNLRNRYCLIYFITFFRNCLPFRMVKLMTMNVKCAKVHVYRKFTLLHVIQAHAVNLRFVHAVNLRFIIIFNLSYGL